MTVRFSKCKWEPWFKVRKRWASVLEAREMSSDVYTDTSDDNWELQADQGTAVRKTGLPLRKPILTSYDSDEVPSKRPKTLPNQGQMSSWSFEDQNRLEHHILQTL